MEQGWSVAAAAGAFGVSVRCARKWVSRYRAAGEAGLVDRSSAPRRVANRTAPERVAGVGFRRAAGVAFASDTVSITTMEIVDNAFILAVPGALAAGLGDALFWWSLAISLVIAFVLTVPVNRWLIARGRGHAVMHELHAH